MLTEPNTTVPFGTGRDTLTPGRNAGPLVGYPYPAKPCRCAVPWVEDDGCVRCGYWLHATIRATWRAQARRMAGEHGNRRNVRTNGSERRSGRSPELAGVAL